MLINRDKIESKVLELRMHKLTLREIAQQVNISHETVRKIIKNRLGVTKIDHLDRIKALAKANRGVLISSEYKGTHYRYVFKCNNNHFFSTRLSDMEKNNSFCTVCSSLIRRRKQLNKIRLHAISKGGLCLSINFTYRTDKYLFQCNKGHQWESTWANMSTKDCWCPKCAYINKRRQSLAV